MKYFFILGNNPALSLAEIASYFSVTKEQLVYWDSKSVIIEFEKQINKDVINKLGGVIKIGEVLDEFDELSPEIFIDCIDKAKDKVNFGISKYGGYKTVDSRPLNSRINSCCHSECSGAERRIPSLQLRSRDPSFHSVVKMTAVSKLPHKKDVLKKLDINDLAMAVKRGLREKGISSRWVSSKDKALSSVVVSENNLLGAGYDFCLLGSEKRKYLGRTIAVQPFKNLSKRDYGRPSRDDYSGMLPPKLAMIMINIAGAALDEKIIDPFCGSGTVVNEALLMGYKKVYGTDLSRKAIKDSEDNFNWLKKHNPDIASPKLQVMDAQDLSKQFGANTFSAIITEPYLGPQRGKKDLVALVNELNQLYSKAIAEFKEILKDDGRVVMVWPCFIDNNKLMQLNPEIEGFRMVHTLDYLDVNFKEITERGSIMYGRTGQRVWREIVVLEKL